MFQKRDRLFLLVPQKKRKPSKENPKLNLVTKADEQKTSSTVKPRR